MLAERGIPFFAVVTDPVWRTKSTRSAYAMFGYMNVDAPQLAYRVSTWLFLTLMGATYLFAIWRWRALSEQVRWGLVAAPIFVALAVFVSLLHSWQGDFQPQGRYLFGAFMPAVVMLAGTVATEPRWLRRSRALVFIVLYALCQGVLWISVLNNTALLK
jgi:peptidoglycan/LPS O-acetylase OafA/YrhL